MYTKAELLVVCIRRMSKKGRYGSLKMAKFLGDRKKGFEWKLAVFAKPLGGDGAVLLRVTATYRLLGDAS